MDKVSIIIVTYNGMQWIEKCLTSIPKIYATIVVDNASTDTTVAFIKSNFSEVQVLTQTENLGFGAANNIGIAYALQQGANYVFLLNQDAYLQPNTIKDLVNCYHKNKEFGILSPIHLNGEGTELDTAFAQYTEQNNNLKRHIQIDKTTTKVFELPFVNAAGWLLPREILAVVGGFDPIFYHYGEDDNYCQRIQYHGFKVGVVTGTFIQHDRAYRAVKKTWRLEEVLVDKERYFKRQLANINVSLNEVYDVSKKILETKVLKSVLKLNFKKALQYYRELKLLKSLLPEIKQSRTINKQRGFHYLKM